VAVPNQAELHLEVGQVVLPSLGAVEEVAPRSRAVAQEPKSRKWPAAKPLPLRAG
jgi:hypothetical protein